eukprot:TRINITY_DN8772_c0_g1_i1.p2 TRINITY_DN8772_c0_g1~~TRINITY_DN8772_c0_g1_i1.p2  ORF type:complete len:116 (-),score=57.45 TRINITY_DN8772_c0_g1_i1:109-456(-)
MMRRPPRSTQSRSSAASDVYKRQGGYSREPSGSKYKHVGQRGRQAFYDMAFAAGGVNLIHCSATFDGRVFAVEYICDEWGTMKFTGQAGMAIYELSSSGKLAAVRIYDDVTPPNE